jgi:hypothetical protein
MRALALVLVLLAPGGAMLACGSLKDAQSGPTEGLDGSSPEGATDRDAGVTPPGSDGGSKDAALKTGDPRWPLWPLPADAPANASYTIANGADGAIVTDTITGLAWQDTVPSTTRDLAAAKIYCDELVYDALGDWRLPTRIEAMSIMSFKPVSGESAMAAPAFSAVAGAQCFWTASKFAQFTDTAWNITPASVTFADATKKCAARCVRGGAAIGAPIAKQYDLIDADTLRDPVTNLVWERIPPETEDTWANAEARCKALALGGRVWRLPGVKELASIVDETKIAPAANGAFGDYAVRMFTANVRWDVDFDQGNAFQAALGFSYWSRCVSGP